MHGYFHEEATLCSQVGRVEVCTVSLHYQSKVWTLSSILTLQFVAEGLKTTYEDTWDYVGNNNSVK